MIIHMRNEDDVGRYGEMLAAELSAGDVVCLTGDLGTGKTALTKAIARGLGVTETITSPTFNIVKEYHSGRIPLYHFDVYRIEDVSELDNIGINEYLNGGGVCVIEWAELIADIIPKGSRVIEMSMGDEPDSRIYETGWS